MELNEIKKLLYRLKLKAKCIHSNGCGKMYVTEWGSGGLHPDGLMICEDHSIYFYVPGKDVVEARSISDPSGEDPFGDIVDAQLLNRYIITQIVI